MPYGKRGHMSSTIRIVKLRPWVVSDLISFLITLISFCIFNNTVFADMTQTAKLLPSDGLQGDHFSQSVAIDGDYSIIGAPDATNVLMTAGSAYIFSRNQGGYNKWGQVVKLSVPNISFGERFGTSVSISGEYVVVGARYDDEKGIQSGSAYIFYRNQGGTNNWGLVKEITASETKAFDEFGRSVFISGDLIIVGAYKAGSAYIFYRNQGGTDSWGELKKLTASDGVSSDYFGYSVSISGDYAIVGAPMADNAGSDYGSSYVFYRNQGGTNAWGQSAKLTASSGASGDYFGNSVSISGNNVMVTAPRNYPFPMEGDATGSVYFFERSGETWNQIYKLSILDGRGFYPDSISIKGNYAIIGWSKANLQIPGAAYVFQKSGAGWTQINKLTASDGIYTDAYGRTADICESGAIVGAEYDADNEPTSGSAYIFSPFIEEEFPWEVFYPAFIKKKAKTQ
jgi:hypothetical protein